MKIALIDNMNNNFFTLSRYLRDEGFDADLFYFDEYEHFLPYNDTFDLSYQNFCFKIKWNGIYDDVSKIKKILNSYDMIIGCGKAPALCSLIGRKINVLIPYGGDVYNVMISKINLNKEVLFHYFKAKIKKYFGINIKYREDIYRLGMLLNYQKLGIQNADHVIYQIEQDNFAQFFEHLGIKSKWIVGFSPIIYRKIYNPHTIVNYYCQSHWYKEFKKIRDNNDFVIFHHSRHIWKNLNNQFEYKGNDRLIRAFARFVKDRSDIKSKLVLLEYGRDYEESAKLIKELKISEHVQWFPLLPRKEIMIGISLCDLGATLFGISGITCGVICEFLAMGKIFIGDRDDEFYIPYYDELYPMLNARTEQDIYNQLVNYVENKSYYDRISIDCIKWNDKYMVNKPLEILRSLISRPLKTIQTPDCQ